MHSCPELLMPRTTEVLHLPSSDSIELPKSEPLFRQWRGEYTGNTYGNKPLVDVDGEPMFAELAILEHFRNDGWDGVWVDTFRKKFRTAWGEEGVVRLSQERRRLLKAIHDRAGSASGCFDVYCWKGESVLFAESKRKRKDSIRDTQLVWLEAAIRTGLETHNFLIVEWFFSEPSARNDARASSKSQRLPGSLKGLANVRAGIAKRSVSEHRPVSLPQDELQIFFDAYAGDAHEGFLRWRERNWRGYVISRRSRTTAMIHRACCGHFEHGDKSASLTRTMKVCSAGVKELEGWARENIEANLKRCRSCM